MADARRFFELLSPDWVEQIHLTALHVFEEVETAGVIGAGSQARYQMVALKKVRDYQRLLVYSLEGVEKYLDEMAPVPGEVSAGMKPGRVDPSEITTCDLTGSGVQDTVIANLAYKKALEQDFGVRIES